MTGQRNLYVDFSDLNFRACPSSITPPYQRPGRQSFYPYFAGVLRTLRPLRRSYWCGCRIHFRKRNLVPSTLCSHRQNEWQNGNRHCRKHDPSTLLNCSLAGIRWLILVYFRLIPSNWKTENQPESTRINHDRPRESRWR